MERLPAAATTQPRPPAHRFCVAPMMDYTDRHSRAFMRILSHHALLYTEMVTARAVLYGDRDRLLDFDAEEHPLALQLGGCEPALMAQAARIGEQYGYDEININVGCPSDRVQEGRFGACLMAEPHVVAECVHAMRRAVEIPVTVKTRIGIDRDDAYEPLHRFIVEVAAAGCQRFVVHARKAWLDGLSPRENREVPPLRYAVVHGLKRDFPHLQIVINGGITDLEASLAHLRHVDGVMLGREVCRNPYLLADVDARLFGATASPISREAAVRAMVEYADRHCAAGVPLPRISRHLLGLFQGRPGARRWRRMLSEQAHRPGAGPDLLEGALAELPVPTSDTDEARRPALAAP